MCILDGRDLLCCTATGDGKSAAFAIPCLVLLEYNNNPEAYPRDLPTRAKSIGPGVVITPTKDLANNIVCSFNSSIAHLLSWQTFQTERIWLILLLGNFNWCKENWSTVRLAEIWGDWINQGWLEDPPREPSSLSGEPREGDRDAVDDDPCWSFGENSTWIVIWYANHEP